MAYYRPLGNPPASFPDDAPLPYETYLLFAGKKTPTQVHTGCFQ